MFALDRTIQVRIAVTSRTFSKHPVLRQELLREYAHVKFNDDGIALKGAELVAFLQDHDAAITALEVIDRNILDALPQLKIISKYGVGLDMLDLDALRTRGIKLGWTAGVNKRAVAELTIAMMLNVLRRIPEAASLVRSGNFKQILGRQLSGKTVGIIGCGNIGKEVVHLLRPFDVRILVYDVRSFPDFYQEHNIEAVHLEELLESADVVSVHVPLDPSTTMMLDRSKLGLMKPGSVLINLSRGGIVDEAALKHLLSNNSLYGAGFDVFMPEPPTDLELANLPNFLPTPHIGGSSEEGVLQMGRAAIRGLKDSRIP